MTLDYEPPEPVNNCCDGCGMTFEKADERHYAKDGDGWVWCESCCPHPECETYHTHYRFEARPQRCAACDECFEAADALASRFDGTTTHYRCPGCEAWTDGDGR